MLPSITQYCPVLPSITEYYPVLSSTALSHYCPEALGSVADAVVTLPLKRQKGKKAKWSEVARWKIGQRLNQPFSPLRPKGSTTESRQIDSRDGVPTSARQRLSFVNAANPDQVLNQFKTTRIQLKIKVRENEVENKDRDWISISRTSTANIRCSTSWNKCSWSCLRICLNTMSTDVKDESAVKLHKALFILCQIYFWESNIVWPFNGSCFLWTSKIYYFHTFVN